MASNYDQKMITSKHFRYHLGETVYPYKEDTTSFEVMSITSLDSKHDSIFGPGPVKNGLNGQCMCDNVHQHTSNPDVVACRYVPAPAIEQVGAAHVGYARLTEPEAFTRWYDAGHRGPVLPYMKGVGCHPDKKHPSNVAAREVTQRWHQYRKARRNQAHLEREEAQDRADEAWLQERTEKRLSGELDREYAELGNKTEQWVAITPGGMEQDVRNEELIQKSDVDWETAWERAASPAFEAVCWRYLQLAPVTESLERRYRNRMRWWQFAEDCGNIRYRDEEMDGNNLVRDFIDGQERWMWLNAWLGWEGGDRPENKAGETCEEIARIAREGWKKCEILGLDMVVPREQKVVW